ncbi:glycosyltransferase family 2 protein [Leuconostoc lactis]|uniref:glycosyltransferase family 2 protein n=1 Tax=Leuconostoc lactis TaxID=1246 RepID=UPI0028A0D5D3|nr:glycosyltransferase [Leuconostoc lactis]
METPLISVVIPVYNVEDYISECVQSIVQQSYKNLEIILVNDGSTDNSILKVSEILVSDDRCRVINKENGGLSDARNVGLNAVTGEYVCFIDSDDYLEQNFIQNLYEASNNSDIIRASFRDIEGEIPKGWIADMPTELTLNGREALKLFLDNNTSFVVWSSLFKVSFLKENGLEFQKGILLEDGDFTTRAYLKAESITFINDKSYRYRIRPGSILTTKNFQKMSNSEEIVISKFLNLIEYEKSNEVIYLLQYSIFAFLRDWTRILYQNNLEFSDLIFKNAIMATKKIVAKRPFNQRVKFKLKYYLIRIKQGFVLFKS